MYYHLQKLKNTIPSYLKDSKELIGMMKELGQLPSNAKLFTADAVSMYTNIDTEHGIETIKKWF